MLRFVVRWPLTLIAVLSLATSQLIAANQSWVAATIPDVMVGIVIAPAYVFLVAAILTTGLRLPWSVIVILPTVMLLDCGLYVLRRKVAMRTGGVARTAE
jgi:hypothetical protein